MHDFSLFIDSGGQTGSSAAELSFARILGSASSRNRSTTACILGVTGTDAEADAARLAEDYVNHRQDSNLARRQPAGVVFLDHSAGTVEVLAAPVGLVQVFWTSANGRLSIASDPRMLEEPGPHIRPLRLESLYQYVYFHMLPSPAAIYEGVEKLDGGHLLHWNGGEAKRSRYWRASFGNESSGTEPERRRELLETLQAAVNRSMGSNGRVGAFLSGGLDSSTVAGMAARVQPGIPTISMGFDAAGYDEMEYARIASSHFKTSPLEYYVTPDDVLRTLPAIITAFTEPFGNSSAAAAYHCARIAREHGIDLLLAGDGGDELFGGNERYAKQMAFERYRSVPEVLRHSLIEPAVSLAGRVTRHFPIGKAVSYIEQSNIPLPDRLQTYNFLHRHEPTEVFSPELLEQVDTEDPLRLLRAEYAACDADHSIDRMLFLDWKFTLHDNDLVKVNSMCKLAGVNVAYPMLDPDVVEFSMRLPAEWKVHDGQLRWFYKRAMQGFLPQQIIDKTKHGFGLPFGVWTRTHEGLRRLSEDSLRSLGTRGFFRPGFLRDALRLHREGHASYYGELVWILMVLELWLQAHLPNARL